MQPHPHFPPSGAHQYEAGRFPLSAGLERAITGVSVVIILEAGAKLLALGPAWCEQFGSVCCCCCVARELWALFYFILPPRARPFFSPTPPTLLPVPHQLCSSPTACPCSRCCIDTNSLPQTPDLLTTHMPFPLSCPSSRHWRSHRNKFDARLALACLADIAVQVLGCLSSCVSCHSIVF